MLYAPLNRRSLYPASLDDIKILNDYIFYSIDLETGQVQIINKQTKKSEKLNNNSNLYICIYCLAN